MLLLKCLWGIYVSVCGCCCVEGDIFSNPIKALLQPILCICTCLFDIYFSHMFLHFLYIQSLIKNILSKLILQIRLIQHNTQTLLPTITHIIPHSFILINKLIQSLPRNTKSLKIMHINNKNNSITILI